jgi:hypothetical protein
LALFFVLAFSLSNYLLFVCCIACWCALICTGSLGPLREFNKSCETLVGGAGALGVVKTLVLVVAVVVGLQHLLVVAVAMLLSVVWWRTDTAASIGVAGIVFVYCISVGLGVGCVQVLNM